MSLGLNLFGQSKQKRAQEKLAEINAESAKLQGVETVRRLELERGNTLSTLTARTGRAGAEVASTGTITPSTPETTTRVKIEQPRQYNDRADRPVQYETITTPGTAAGIDVSGAGGSVLIQQQRIADLYEQEIIYTRKQTALAAEGADVQADFNRQSANLDMIGTILEAGSDLYKMKYAFDQYNIPEMKPQDEDWWY